MSKFHPGQMVALDRAIKKGQVTIPAGTEVEIVTLIPGTFDEYLCDLDGWSRLTVFSHDLEPLEQKHIDELVKPLECPEETPEEREHFAAINAKLDSLSRRVDLIANHVSDAHFNKRYEG